MAIGKKTRFEVFKRDKFTCQYCGQSAPDVLLEVDHIKPRSKGGPDDIVNYDTWLGYWETVRDHFSNWNPCGSE